MEVQCDIPLLIKEKKIVSENVLSLITKEKGLGLDKKDAYVYLLIM